MGETCELTSRCFQQLTEISLSNVETCLEPAGSVTKLRIWNSFIHHISNPFLVAVAAKACLPLEVL